MVMLYTGVHYMGTLEAGPGLLVRLVRGGDRVELRDEAGNQIGNVIPANESVVP